MPNRGFRDRLKAGRSAIVPYLAGEDPGDRHERRLRANLQHEQDVREQAAARGLSLCILNDGQHWILSQFGFLAEWWPRSAKLVFNKQWKRGVHAHDYLQVFREIDEVRR